MLAPRRRPVPLLLALSVVVAPALVLAGDGQGDPPRVDGRLRSRFMLRGYCYGDSEAWEGLGGHGRSSNRPAPTPDDERGKHSAVVLVARLDQQAEFRGTAGFTLLLINATGERQGFSASDSRLRIVQEAKDREGAWRPIEYLPSSWCGNSYHTVFLEPGEHWAFAAPRYAGPFETRLRFRLEQGGDHPPIYSQEFEGSIHETQFTDKEGHQPTNVMDPYDE